MDKLRYRQLKAFVELDYKGRHDDIPQFHFHREDLKWLFEMAEKAEIYERSLRTIAQDNGKESNELIEMASKALRI
ncbi:hypothetical protein MLOOGBEN_17820 [Bacillus sp. EB106-08-02-XG196]|uniref:hypothetical protein n=1 Tax=Bacillus sp. EB106-08-02-XG196 TaxID=2737049 RepID=UPI0015C485FA|nr:hypothetical protein [Bacillus sp. EB106-08-02-XG196]NWQ42561.1 hypothetical protein [Bacillus sp. EB106-08-02-XG196]